MHGFTDTHFLNREWFEWQYGRNKVWGCLKSGVRMRSFRQSQRPILLTVPLFYLGDADDKCFAWLSVWFARRAMRSTPFVVSARLLSKLGTDQRLSETWDQSSLNFQEDYFHCHFRYSDAGCSSFCQATTFEENLRKLMVFSEVLTEAASIMPTVAAAFYFNTVSTSRPNKLR